MEPRIVHYGRTPLTVTLPASSGYMGRARYKIRATSDAGAVTETELNAKLNGWYWGNLVLGGVVGFFIIDPLTGAMFRLPETVIVPCGGDVGASTAR